MILEMIIAIHPGDSGASSSQSYDSGYSHDSSSGTHNQLPDGESF